MNEIISTHDLKSMDRFDAGMSVGKIKVSTTGITLTGVNGFKTGDEVAVYLAKNGKVILLVPEKGGYTVSNTGRGGKTKAIACRPVIHALELRSIAIPQEADLDKDNDGYFCASLISVH